MYLKMYCSTFLCTYYLSTMPKKYLTVKYLYSTLVYFANVLNAQSNITQFSSNSILNKDQSLPETPTSSIQFPPLVPSFQTFL